MTNRTKKLTYKTNNFFIPFYPISAYLIHFDPIRSYVFHPAESKMKLLLSNLIQLVEFANKQY